MAKTINDEKIVDKNIFEFCGMQCCQGEIQIKKFKETFNMPLYFWNMEDYQKQWEEGIERLKTHERSCLVVAMQDPNTAPWANLWVLYKEGDKVYIHNNLLFGERFTKMLKKQPFNLKTCYDFRCGVGFYGTIIIGVPASTSA